MEMLSEGWSKSYFTLIFVLYKYYFSTLVLSTVHYRLSADSTSRDTVRITGTIYKVRVIL